MTVEQFAFPLGLIGVVPGKRRRVGEAVQEVVGIKDLRTELLSART
jgi:hypothetical protein